MKTKPKNHASKLFLLYSFLFFIKGNAQESVNAGGGDATGSGGSVAYSIGQVFFASNTSSSGSQYQGIQYAYVTTSIFANVKALLKGPLSGTTMSIALNTKGLIPKSQPYNAIPWGYSGSESVPAIPANVTDWVLVELRDANTPATVVATRAAFIKNDGSIVDTDGSSKVEFKNLSVGNYYIAIKHRNHLAIRTATAQAMVSTPSGATLYDFTTAPTQANGSNAMIQSGTVYAMWSGDVNSDGNVYNTGSPQDASQVVNGVANRLGNTLHLPSFIGFSNVYNNLDVNMDGNVNNTATPQDASIIVNNVANAPGNTLHLPSFKGLKTKL